jgi:riboflavin synthase
VFTGIVTARGVVRSARARRGGSVEIEVEAPTLTRSGSAVRPSPSRLCSAVRPSPSRALKRGDSVAVNGVCLSATEVRRRRFSVTAMGETVARSTIGELRRGHEVNLELPLRLADRLGGHLVQGHVDGVAEALRVEREDAARRVWWAIGDDLLRYMAPKGSIALDGVSLTVVEVGRTSFQVALIPLTLEETTLGRVKAGAKANLEVDLIAKYVERLATR